MSADDIKLLPCPFCGGAAHLEEHPPHKHFLVDMPDHPGSATIECGRCEAGMIAETAEAVAAAWNRRAAPSPQGDAWQPIETAPKDGTRVLLATPRGRMADGEFHARYGVWSWPYVMVEPTLWRPLPTPPIDAARSTPAKGGEHG